MPRDNLLNSACLELFEFIRRETVKPFVVHVVEKYREKLQAITYVDTFHNLIVRYEQMQGYDAEAESAIFAQEQEVQAQAQRMHANGQRWQGVGEMDAAEEAYFNTSDDEEEVGLFMLLLLQYANVCSGRSPIPWRIALSYRPPNRWSIIRMTMTMQWTSHNQNKHQIGGSQRSKKHHNHQRSPPTQHHRPLPNPHRNGYQRSAVVRKKTKTNWSS